MNYTMSPVIFDDELLDFELDFRDSDYKHNSNSVPRVTKILKFCSDNEALLSWAGNLPPNIYRSIHNSATKIGTIAHEKIGNYINYTNGSSNIEDLICEDPFILDKELDKINTAYANFKEWYKAFNSVGFKFDEVIGLEIPITSPWYGGTIDAIVRINGLYYIIDFKTSKSIRNEYLLQTSAYMWAVNEYHSATLPHISGIGIIRVDKTSFPKYEDLFLNEQNQFQSYIINQMQVCFCSMVEAYYRSAHIEILGNQFQEKYDDKLLKKILRGK